MVHYFEREPQGTEGCKKIYQFIQNITSDVKLLPALEPTGNWDNPLKISVGWENKFSLDKEINVVY